MRPTIDEYFMNMVSVVKTRSTCLRRSVGCVLVNARGHVLATGYNGVARGAPHCNEELEQACQTWEHAARRVEELYKQGVPAHVKETGSTRVAIYPHACSGASAASGERLDACEAIHAEQNALLQCRDVWEIQTCYASCSPCVHCVKLLLNTGCTRLVYTEAYDPRALALWAERGKSALLLK
jgi:dCMP deaminase